MMFQCGQYGTGAARSSKIPYLFNIFDGMLNNISNLMVQNSSTSLMSPGQHMIGGMYRQGIYWLFSLSGTYFMLEISQSKLPDGASPVFLIIYADKTRLSSFGTVAGMCSGTAEDVAVRWMPRGMLSRPGETLRNVAEWQWKSWQPGDAVRRQAKDGTMVGGSAGDRSGGRIRVAKRKTHRRAEDASGGGRHIGRRKTHREQKQSPRQKGVA